MQVPSEVDLLVVGGGINGAGIARDAAGRGLSLALCEQNDFAGATSSASTKLIHGGLRYLEYYEFRLVAEALAEREVLLGIAPHIAHPLRFVMPHVQGLRPAWMIRLGLFLYDRLGGRSTLPKSCAVRLPGSPLGAGLKPQYRKGFVYSDARVDDARLVILNLRSAAAHGAHILPRMRFCGAERVEGRWHARLEDLRSGEHHELHARMLVNAAGPWVSQVAGTLGQGGGPAKVRLVKGSHIVVPRLYQGDHAYIVQDAGKRIIFMIPYEREFTLIGTTDVAVDAAADGVRISREEIDYLCTSVSRYTPHAVTPDMVVWSYSGVRPLYDNGKGDPSAVTRDYTLVLDDGGQNVPQLSIFGGKITTYRRLAESAMDKLQPWLGERRGKWTGTEGLPGADMGQGGAAGLLARLGERYPRLPAALLPDLVRRYGSLAYDVLGESSEPDDLGRDFGGGLYEREVRYLIEHEWAYEADDILWRRTKTGLHMNAQQRAELGDFLAGMPGLQAQDSALEQAYA
ncbi:glycerol-3-phosphate dehydrogenase [Candidimonas nitroreducens]|uniref:Glycerol-3-phosphate dehydrogenase n=1 Tax=Candidimonas nitroreducens TaxID=683354 RepID=A0A225N2L2_9BURK|nr:glycerol-3-phosphate dehydrogenase [Candidimonas nitroreducens]OWT66340.1 glycerol-3-phosphate dehydrogenase [Candidimonas nitroreducens]